MFLVWVAQSFVGIVSILVQMEEDFIKKLEQGEEGRAKEVLDIRMLSMRNWVAGAGAASALFVLLF